MTYCCQNCHFFVYYDLCNLAPVFHIERKEVIKMKKVLSLLLATIIICAPTFVFCSGNRFVIEALANEVDVLPKDCPEIQFGKEYLIEADDGVWFRFNADCTYIMIAFNHFYAHIDIYDINGNSIVGSFADGRDAIYELNDSTEYFIKITGNSTVKVYMPVSECEHICHNNGFLGFIWKIINFFGKLFGMNPVCECGAAHY